MTAPTPRRWSGRDLGSPLGDALQVSPANEASWDELLQILTGTAARCQCTRRWLGDREWWHLPVEQRAAILRDAAGCDDPRAASTVGLVAWLGDEPVGWAAVDARPAYRRLRGSPAPWAGRPTKRRLVMRLEFDE